MGLLDADVCLWLDGRTFVYPAKVSQDDRMRCLPGKDVGEDVGEDV